MFVINVLELIIIKAKATIIGLAIFVINEIQVALVVMLTALLSLRHIL